VTPGEFQALYPHVIGWIRLTLAAHEKNAKSVASVGFVRLPLYFSHELIASTKYVAVNRPPMPPLSALGLKRFAAFEQGDYDGATYLDTFFLKTSHVANEGLYFHELIHVVQWPPPSMNKAHLRANQRSHVRISPDYRRRATSKDFQLVVFAAGGFTGSFSGVAVGVG
jgi:hypothetical protein